MTARAALAAAIVLAAMTALAGCGPASEGEPMKTSSACPVPGTINQDMEPAPAPGERAARTRPEIDRTAPQEFATATFGLG